MVRGRSRAIGVVSRTEGTGLAWPIRPLGLPLALRGCRGMVCIKALAIPAPAFYKIGRTGGRKVPARVAELADAPGLGPGPERGVGSNPAPRSKAARGGIRREFQTHGLRSVGCILSQIPEFVTKLSRKNPNTRQGKIQIIPPENLAQPCTFWWKKVQGFWTQNQGLTRAATKDYPSFTTLHFLEGKCKVRSRPLMCDFY